MFSTTCDSASFAPLYQSGSVSNQGREKFARGQIRQVGWMEHESLVTFGQKSPEEKQCGCQSLGQNLHTFS
jgi:hypothetical protein